MRSPIGVTGEETQLSSGLLQFRTIEMPALKEPKRLRQARLSRILQRKQPPTAGIVRLNTRVVLQSPTPCLHSSPFDHHHIHDHGKGRRRFLGKLKFTDLEFGNTVPGVFTPVLVQRSNPNRCQWLYRRQTGSYPGGHGGDH
jgi:hypothetical protein